MGMATSSMSDQDAASAKSFVESEIAAHKVVVFSKTYCGYCSATKDLLQRQVKPGSDLTIHELDRRGDGGAIQSTLADLTGQRTVPNVFIGGQHVGGNDKVQRAHRTGELQKMLSSL